MGVERGRWGDKEIGRWADGEMGIRIAVGGKRGEGFRRRTRRCGNDGGQ